MFSFHYLGSNNPCPSIVFKNLSSFAFYWPSLSTGFQQYLVPIVCSPPVRVLISPSVLFGPCITLRSLPEGYSWPFCFPFIHVLDGPFFPFLFWVEILLFIWVHYGCLSLSHSGYPHVMIIFTILYFGMRTLISLQSDSPYSLFWDLFSSAS